MPKKIYIPGFGNSNDDIQKKYVGENSHVIQANLRQVDTKKIQEFLDKYGDSAFEKLQKKYPGLTKEIFVSFVDKIDKFKGRTRDIITTVELTTNEIKENLLLGETLEIFGHSQGGLVAMMTIIKHPELLHSITNIELLAPVSSFKVGRGFHSTDSGYLHGKNILVREEYIKSLESEGNILEEFLDAIKHSDFSGSVKLKLGSSDPIVPVSDFDLLKLKKEYVFLDIEIKEGDHYLGFKK